MQLDHLQAIDRIRQEAQAHVDETRRQYEQRIADMRQQYEAHIEDLKDMVRDGMTTTRLALAKTLSQPSDLYGDYGVNVNDPLTLACGQPQKPCLILIIFDLYSL